MKFKEKFNKELEKWLKSDGHRYNCASYNEGQYCCLDAEKDGNNGHKFVLDFFLNEIKELKEEIEEKQIEQDLNSYDRGWSNAITQILTLIDNKLK